MENTFHDLDVFVAIGDHNWIKDYCPREALRKWYEAVDYRTQAKEVTLIAIKCNLDEVSVDNFGGVNFPTGSECIKRRVKINRRLLEKAEDLRDNLEEAMMDLTDIVEELE